MLNFKKKVDLKKRKPATKVVGFFMPDIPLTIPVSSDFKLPGLKRPQEPLKGETPLSPSSQEEKAPEIVSLDGFEKEQGYPYVADYYQLDTPYEFVDVGMRENLEMIDVFIKGRLKDEGKETTLKTCAKSLKTIEKKLGIDDSTMRNLAVIKVANLARNFNLVLDAFSKTARHKIKGKLKKIGKN